MLPTNKLTERPYVHNKRIFLSIIIPTFNEADNIVRLLDDIRNRIPKDTEVEILIVDDNSPDGTGSLVEEYIQNDFDPKRNLFDLHQLIIKYQLLESFIGKDEMV